MTSLEPLVQALQGCPFREEETAEVLDRFPLGEMFGGIRKEEILETFFHAGDLN